MNSFSSGVLLVGLILIAVVAWQTYVIYGLKTDLESREKAKSANYLDLLGEKPFGLSADKSLNLFEEIQVMQQELDNSFRRLSAKHSGEPYFKLAFNNFFYAPSLDVVSKNGEYIIKADIPGVKKSDIKITVDDNVLNIMAEINTFNDENSSNYIRKERFISKFQRSISLALDVDFTKMEHKYEDGVLTITIPKKKQTP
jgi:HSP20 family protein